MEIKAGGKWSFLKQQVGKFFSKDITMAERRRRVFQTARPIFIGGNAKLRKKADVARVIEGHEGLFLDLFQEFGEDPVIVTIANLLGERVFESHSKAMRKFPDLCQHSATGSLQHETPEQSATAAEAGAFQNGSQGGSQVNSDEIGVSNENVAGQLFISGGIRNKRD